MNGVCDVIVDSCSLTSGVKMWCDDVTPCAGQLLLGRRQRAVRSLGGHLSPDPQRGGEEGAPAGCPGPLAADQPWHHHQDT